MNLHRRKIVTTGALRSRKLAAISHEAERVYWRVYMASDNFGTMSADPWDVWQAACPGVRDVDEFSIADAVDELVEVGLLQRWFADDRFWIHVLGHDKHQSAEFIRKRGKCRTPTPPAIHAGPTPEDAGLTPAQGQTTPAQRSNPSADAEGRPTRENSQTLTTTSTSTSLSTSNSIPTSSIVTPISALSGSPTIGIDQLEAEVEAAWIARLTETLTPSLASSASGVVELSLFPMLNRRHRGFRPPRRPSLSEIEAAVVKFAACVADGMTVDGEPAALIHSMIPSAGLEVEVRTMTPEDRKAAEAAERAARNDAIIAAAWGGVSA